MLQKINFRWALHNTDNALKFRHFRTIGSASEIHIDLLSVISQWAAAPKNIVRKAIKTHWLFSVIFFGV